MSQQVAGERQRLDPHPLVCIRGYERLLTAANSDVMLTWLFLWEITMCEGFNRL